MSRKRKQDRKTERHNKKESEMCLLPDVTVTAVCVYALPPIHTTMPNCSDSHSSSYSLFSSARELSSFCSGRFLIRLCKHTKHSNHFSPMVHRKSHSFSLPNQKRKLMTGLNLPFSPPKPCH